MARLIDADELKIDLMNLSEETGMSIIGIFDLINNAPTVEPRIEYDTDGQPYRLFMSGSQVVPDMLQGWRYEERPKGKWIGDTDYESCQGNYEAYKCSECGYGIDWRKHHQLMCQDKIPEEYREYYCPHCGADMRGEEE